RWERNGNRVLLRSVSFDVVADPSTPIAEAVQAANYDPIILAFNIEAFGPDDAPVIETTRMFTSEVPEFSARQRLGARGFDPTRSFLEKTTSFPENINIEVTQTYTSPADAAPAGGGRAGGPALPPSATVLMHYSMVKLPEKPMQPRLFDERVGYFSVAKYDYSLDVAKAEQRRFITRYRLEKKDPNAALSEPIKPIVYYIDRATPAKWIPYMKAGIEKWQEAFEAAGFKDAILAKMAPTPQEDPDFSPEDARYSVIRWLPSTTENASGPHINDPRTGEILESDIQFYHNVMNLGRDWYFTQVGPLDKRAQKLPLPDSLAGRLLEYVTAHEVGHTLGFQHNMKASSMYPVDSVRSKTWVKKMGHTPTLMDYSRFNYVAQPEDGIDLADLIPNVGPYDKYAVMWGYSPIPNANTPEAEKATLNKWAGMQDTIPWYRFSGDNGGVDPGEQSEAVGDADAVKATTYGVKNLKRVMGFLESASAYKPGDTYDNLEELYGRVVGQWSTEMNHVARVIGGQYRQEKVVGQKGAVYRIVEPRRQREALQYLLDNAFTTQDWLMDESILRKLEPTGTLARIGGAEARVLNSILSNDKLQRMLELEGVAKSKSEVYPLAEMLSDLRAGVWKEVKSGESIDVFRRRLQRAYLESLATKINPPPAPAAAAPAGGGGGRGGGAAPVGTADFRPILKAEVRALDADLASAIPRTNDRMTKAHLEDARDQIKAMLDVGNR
ncbi:MAG: zinc-dependent metalloprotease, partial [Gemmatimonas sp.]